MYLKKIQDVIVDKTGIEPDEITPTSHFEEDLNIGEIEFQEIILEIEKEYGLNLSEYTEEIETIEELVNVLSEELD